VQELGAENTRRREEPSLLSEPSQMKFQDLLSEDAPVKCIIFI
jgi:hypothetical protein